MRLSTKGQYAVRAMVDLAYYSKDKPVTLQEIASREEISINYLEQLFAKLRRNRIVDSVRGPGGGYLLRSPSSPLQGHRGKGPSSRDCKRIAERIAACYRLRLS